MHTERQTTQHIRYGLTPLPFSRNVVYTGGHKGSGVREGVRGQSLFLDIPDILLRFRYSPGWCV